MKSQRRGDDHHEVKVYFDDEPVAVASGPTPCAEMFSTLLPEMIRKGHVAAAPVRQEGAAAKDGGDNRSQPLPVSLDALWSSANARRHELIETKQRRELNAEESTEFRELQRVAGLVGEILSGPLPPPAAAPADHPPVSDEEMLDSISVIPASVDSGWRDMGSALRGEPVFLIFPSGNITITSLKPKDVKSVWVPEEPIGWLPLSVLPLAPKQEVEA